VLLSLSVSEVFVPVKSHKDIMHYGDRSVSTTDFISVFIAERRFHRFRTRAVV